MEQEEDKKGLFSSLRSALFPVKPEDGLVKRALKNSGFYLFAVMLLLTTLALITAVAFVL
ncbi:hypothetical protein [Chitinophaga vietnamensis]|uniref:hypothetical protein n=1 Tax=Chitinophaga vietnamensis TaxID=2593957 RepID=UPI001177D4B7|nr:hypothetical protein [Chitinophaga vietnamensis]